jgi:hypothetical protein
VPVGEVAADEAGGARDENRLQGLLPVNGSAGQK